MVELRRPFNNLKLTNRWNLLLLLNMVLVPPMVVVVKVDRLPLVRVHLHPHMAVPHPFPLGMLHPYQHMDIILQSVLPHLFHHHQDMVVAAVVVVVIFQ